MGFRYRKTKTFKNGVKVSAGKSASVGFGGRRAGVSINSKRGVHVRASIPGTGISYSAKLGGGRRKRKSKKLPSCGFLSWIVCLLIFVFCCSVFPVLIPVFILCVIGIFVWAYVSTKRKNKAEAGDNVDDSAGTASTSVAYVGNSDVDRHILTRHCEILADCDELVHTSKNFETVLRRYYALLDELSFIASCEDAFGPEYLAQCGLRIKTDGVSVADLWEKMRTNGATILNAAVDRCLDAEIDTAQKLKTTRGQEARMSTFVSKIEALDGVPAEVLKYVNSLPILDALREPAVNVTCTRCGHKFRARPHAHKGYLLDCPKCGQSLHVDTSRK